MYAACSVPNGVVDIGVILRQILGPVLPMLRVGKRVGHGNVGGEGHFTASEEVDGWEDGVKRRRE